MRDSFEDVFGRTVEVGDTVVTVTTAYSNAVLVIGEVVKITAARINVRNKPHAGFRYEQTFQIDDSLNRVVKVEDDNER